MQLKSFNEFINEAVKVKYLMTAVKMGTAGSLDADEDFIGFVKCGKQEYKIYEAPKSLTNKFGNDVFEYVRVGFPRKSGNPLVAKIDLSDSKFMTIGSAFADTEPEFNRKERITKLEVADQKKAQFNNALSG